MRGVHISVTVPTEMTCVAPKGGVHNAGNNKLQFIVTSGVKG